MTSKDVQPVDPAKRRLLRKIGVGMGAAFVVPLLASFSQDGLLVSAARANPSDIDGNHDHTTPPGPKKKGGGKK